jgi:tetratricopeptide (TPR) repeat protein
LVATNVSELLAQAEAARRAGQADAAARHLQSVLELEPQNPQALNSLGVRAVLAGDVPAAVDFFSRATAAHPNDQTLWLNLADAQRTLGDDEGERASLNRLLSIDRFHIVGLIRKAELHERLGEETEAHVCWLRFSQRVSAIQQRSPALEERLAHARAFMAARAAKIGPMFEEGLASARSEVEPEERRRFDAWVDRFLGKRRIYTNVCTGVHIPFLPAEEFFPRHHFPWMEPIEAKTDAIRAELIGLLEEVGERVLQIALDRALQRPRAVDRIVADAAEPARAPPSVRSSVILRSLSSFCTRPTWMSTIGAHMLLPEAVEQDDLVQPVEELGPEMAAHDLHHLRLDLLGHVRGRRAGWRDTGCRGSR